MQLSISQRVTLVDSGDGLTGRGQISMGPQVYGREWRIKRIVVTTVPPVEPRVNNSECRVYRTVETPSAQLEATASGDDDVSETDILMVAPDNMLFVWKDGDIGAIATAVIEGEAGWRGETQSTNTNRFYRNARGAY